MRVLLFYDNFSKGCAVYIKRRFIISNCFYSCSLQETSEFNHTFFIMAITCWAPDCNHNNLKNDCGFFRFPKDKKLYRKWLSLLRRNSIPRFGDRVCSCHFVDGKKDNLPTKFVRNVEKLFQKHHLTPEKKKSRRRLFTDVKDQPSTSTAEEFIVTEVEDIKQK